MQSMREPPAGRAVAKVTGPGAHALRSNATRRKICAAVIACLDEHGYSDTSISRVQMLAGVSRGAMTHQFPSKEDMMVATLEQLLAPVRGERGWVGNPLASTRGANKRPLEHDLVRIWTQVVDTREGRALVEILVAARTDATLQDKTAPALRAYNEDVNQNMVGIGVLSASDADDLATLWTICRAFLRGLHLQRRFDDDPKALQNVIESFARIMAPHLNARGAP